jgi:hypothetical protein
MNININMINIYINLKWHVQYEFFPIDEIVFDFSSMFSK